MSSQHPLVAGRFSHKMKGQWVRLLRTGQVGLISYAQFPGPLHPTLSEPVVWVVCPPSPVNPGLKIYAATYATLKEVRKLRRPPS
jgi:hypothetical protein